MTISTPATTPSAGRGAIIAGVVLLVVAIAGILLYAFGAPDQAATATPLGAMRGALIWVAALCGGGGAALLVVGLLRRSARRRARDAG